MKLKDKLAVEYANIQGPDEEFATAMLAYISGFEKAKELILETDYSDQFCILKVGEEEA